MTTTDSSVSPVVLDLDREARMGLPEAILCEPKRLAHLEQILTEVQAAQRPLLLTRLTEAQHHGLADRFALEWDPVSRLATFQWSAEPPPSSRHTARVVVVAAGTSDVPVAKEAVGTLRFHHVVAEEVYDVGVAGLHRYLRRAEVVRSADVVIAVAGMDAALASVVGGDVAAPVIAVPTSVGYGVAAQGYSALHSMLASCASGVTVVNIDNGYGAACAALRILRMLRRHQDAVAATGAG
jgi:NCAIR mutase (PurE)-related protein